MTRQHPPLYATEHILEGVALTRNNTFRTTIERMTAKTGPAISATGVGHATAIALQAGDVISNVSFVTGATAAVSPTAGFVALYDATASGDPTLMAQSADFGSTARAANTAYTEALETAQTITKPGLYYVSISFTAATVPTLVGISVLSVAVSGAIVTGMPVLAQSHGSALGGTAPSTITSPSTVSAVAYYILT